MDDIRKKLLSYLKKHDEVVEKAGPHWGPDTPSSPSEMAETGKRFTSAEPETRKRKEPRSQGAPPSHPSASSASSRPSDSPWRELPEGMQRRYRKGMHPGGGPYSGTVVDVVPKEKKKPDYSQGSPSMHPGGGAYTSKQLRTLVKDFLREYDI